MKLITVDVWNTILVGNADFKMELYMHLSDVLSVDYEVLRRVSKEVKDIVKTTDTYVTQYKYCRMFLNKLNNYKLNPDVLAAVINSYFKNYYKPLFVHRDVVEIIHILKNYYDADIRILSNVGYLNSNQLSKIIGIRVIGSDLVGHLKPSPDFYRNAIYPYKPSSEWLHIGDSDELDIEPVKALGGKTYKITSAKDWDNIINNPSL